MILQSKRSIWKHNKAILANLRIECSWPTDIVGFTKEPISSIPVNKKIQYRINKLEIFSLDRKIDEGFQQSFCIWNEHPITQVILNKGDQNSVSSIVGGGDIFPWSSSWIGSINQFHYSLTSIFGRPLKILCCQHIDGSVPF